MAEHIHKLISFTVMPVPSTQSLPPFLSRTGAQGKLAGCFGGESSSWGLAPLLAKLICEDECEDQG